LGLASEAEPSAIAARRNIDAATIRVLARILGITPPDQIQPDNSTEIS
jgi:hypothetical protein